MGYIEWIKTYWWAVVLMGVGLILLMAGESLSSVLPQLMSHHYPGMCGVADQKGFKIVRIDIVFALSIRPGNASQGG